VAFHVGHTFLSGSLLFHDSNSAIGSISLMNAFFDPTLFHNNTIVLDEVLIGQSNQAANAADTKIIPEVRDFLFGHPVGGAGLDLVSLNVQRGRDNGCTKYNDMRARLGLTRLSTFSEVTGGDAAVAAELASVYATPDECDPWICGLAPHSYPTSVPRAFNPFFTSVKNPYSTVSFDAVASNIQPQDRSIDGASI
jgi:peroxidase